MSWAIALAACAGWALAGALALGLRRRLSLVADAEHELRGAAAAIGLAVERVSRHGATIGFSSLIRLQLDRMAAGLEDLAAARAPRHAGRAASAGDADMDAGRLAQVLGNLIANATEHGTGSVDVRTSRPAGAVRIEIRNRNRPRELEDASAARADAREQSREEAGVVIARALVFHVVDVGPGVDVGSCGHARAQLVEAVAWLG